MNSIKKIFTNSLTFVSKEQNITTRRKIYNSLWAVFFGIVLSSLAIMMLNNDPIEVIRAFIRGSFRGSNISRFWTYFSIFGISSMAVGIGFKVGLFNIGVAGQMMLGGMLAIWFILSNGSAPWVFATSILIAILAAAGLALVAAILKAILNVHEVVTTILSNWVVVYIGKFMYNRQSPFKNSFANGSIEIKSESSFFTIDGFWIFGIIITVILGIGLWFILQKTILGYKIKMTGLNKNASKYAGVNEKIAILSTLAFSGALAGFAGWIFYVILNRNFAAQELPHRIGFEGIAISLLAYNSPVGLLFSSFLYSIFWTGSAEAASSPTLSNEAISIIPATILYLAALSTLFMKFKLMHLLRKQLFWISKNEYWQQFKINYKIKLKIWKKYFREVKMANQKIKNNKNKIREIRKKQRNGVDFNLIEKMSDNEKVEYYEKIHRLKIQSNKQLQELSFFDKKDLVIMRKAELFNQKNHYRNFKENLFNQNKNTEKEFIIVPILKMKKFLNQKGGK